MPLLIWFLALIVYIFLTWICLQNDELFGVYKWVFSLALVPMFLFLMFANIWIADHVSPHIIEWHRTQWTRLWMDDWDLFNGFFDRKIQTLIAFLITSFLPIGLCWGWYRVFARLSRRRFNAFNSSSKRTRPGRSA